MLQTIKNNLFNLSIQFEQIFEHLLFNCLQHFYLSARQNEIDKF